MNHTPSVLISRAQDQRRAAPERARIPLGNRATYASGEGST